MSIFDGIKNPMNQLFPESKLFDIPKGKFTEGTESWSGPIKAKSCSLEDQCRILRAVYDTPPRSQERYRLVAAYLQLFCSSFCGVIYDPHGDEAPLVTYTDAECNMQWFEVMLERMCNLTKEEMQSDVSDQVLKLFMESEA